MVQPPTEANISFYISRPENLLDRNCYSYVFSYQKLRHLGSFGDSVALVASVRWHAMRPIGGLLLVVST